MARKTKEEAEHTRDRIIDAAQRVFHDRGVSRSSLEKVAQAAGVTRGAVYWHFANKTELFFAMRERMSLDLFARTEALLLSETIADPLDAMEAAMKEFFRILEERQDVRQVFEIIFLRCEYVDEFARVQEELKKPAYDFLDKVNAVYRRAAAQGTLRAGLAPERAARDTWIFMGGLIHHIVESPCREGWLECTGELVANHVALRRNPATAR
ncbi:TetR family transcriptional regulator [Denitratisoma oestradiolicum]|uniref:Transcriptional regulator, TetR family n=1 Tax=Denitratisoma oestradiolicum TaxID=311182 RepID=A0A6S6Y1W3_9PROT|nr:TetR family transcriptional regulator [Denitratisoma oestradiolicum]TWO80783.1 TetR family transcriptional regulator [Denitratisoma oestradiolicum]CAB1370901.1 Transcriptional regulator, TetR family [Denitratisoma oestradiolicum]